MLIHFGAHGALTTDTIPIGIEREKRLQRIEVGTRENRRVPKWHENERERAGQLVGQVQTMGPEKTMPGECFHSPGNNMF